MAYELTILGDEKEYKDLFESLYCNPLNPIFTFDGIRVVFYNDKFERSFYRSSNWEKRDKNVFSVERAQRITWIKDALLDKSADLREGWDRDTKTYDDTRRVAIVVKDYVVVIRIQNSKTAKFITAYVADSDALKKLVKSPIWSVNKKDAD